MQTQPAATAGRLYVLGLGPGDASHTTPAALLALHAVSDVLGYFPYVARARLAWEHNQASAPHAALPQPHWHPSDNREELARAREALALAAQGRQVALVSSGDPGVFAMAAAVFEAIDSAAPAEQALWQALDVQVLPGVTAMLAAAARVGAPLGHDFCCINLSDNLKPWAVIEQRVRLALEADFALALYNPRSRSRPEGFARLLQLLGRHCEPERLLIFAHAVCTPQERIHTCALAQAREDMADMRTVVLIGSSATRRVGRWVYTPRFYAGSAGVADAADATAGGEAGPPARPGP